MARNTVEVLLGPGYLYTAAENEAFPTLTANDTPDTDPSGNWVDIGYSEDGWNLVADVTYEFWTPAEEVDPIVTIKTAQEIHVRGVAAQFSLETVQLAMGGGTISQDAGPPATQTYSPPTTTDYDTFAVLFRTKAPTATLLVRDIRVPKAISMSSIDIPHTKGANPSLVAVDLRAVKKTGSDIFDIHELTGA